MSNKPSILVCDDEEGIRESLKLILNDTYDLTVTCSGKECLDQLDKNKDIKLVLIDIKMPEQNGLEVTKEIKRLHPNTKVIIVTGYASAEIAQEAAQLGADAYITKPFESKDILKKVSSFA
jgi:CheY-like chemotaxis protein